MMRLIAAAAALMLAPVGAVASEPAAVWHACDEAAVEAGFPEASLPDRDRMRLSSNTQAGGRRRGQTMLVLVAPTPTGTVFCMTDESLAVKLYKFDGKEIIRRD
jgi:hypothetical protein